mgnify:CR=1 FL=1
MYGFQISKNQINSSKKDAAHSQYLSTFDKKNCNVVKCLDVQNEYIVKCVIDEYTDYWTILS